MACKHWHENKQMCQKENQEQKMCLVLGRKFQLAIYYIIAAALLHAPILPIANGCLMAYFINKFNC